MSLYWLATIAFQVYCIWHCYKNKGDRFWYFLIIIFPLVGCIAYLVTNVLNKSDVSAAQESISKIVNPTANIKKLQARLEFSDTHQNRMNLADAYLAAKMYHEAIELYESTMKGMYSNDLHISMQLMKAYYETGRYTDVLPLYENVKNAREFADSQAWIAYAISLEMNGDNDSAEAEFEKMNRSYSNYENRYEYALFLMRKGKGEKAHSLLNEMVVEFKRMTSVEKRHVRQWEAKVRRLLLEGEKPS